MKTRCLLVTVFAALLAGCATEQSGDNVLSRQEKKEGWVLLFDGSTTRGWHGYNKKEMLPGWIVEDGVLVGLGKGGDIGGDIVTDDMYDNFELALEWKIAEGGNSGIFYHVVEGEQYSAPYQTGPEYQLIDDVGFPGDLEEWQQAGADYAMHPANDEKVLKPVGEWNTARIVFDHGHVEHWLNGRKIVEFEAWTDDWKAKVAAGKWKDYPDYGLAENGSIGLQDHGSHVYFKNIKIKRLD